MGRYSRHQAQINNGEIASRFKGGSSCGVPVTSSSGCGLRLATDPGVGARGLQNGEVGELEKVSTLKLAGRRYEGRSHAMGARRSFRCSWG